MEKNVEHDMKTTIRVYRDYMGSMETTPTIENQIESNLESQMETRPICYIGI